MSPECDICEGVMPDGLIPEGVIPEGVIPDGVIPDGVMPDGICDGVSSDESYRKQYDLCQWHKDTQTSRA